MAGGEDDQTLAARFIGLVRDANRVRHPDLSPGVLLVEPSERAFDGAVLAFRLPDSWRLVTAGLARPDRDRPAASPDASGLGIELSIRLAAGDDSQPPPWGARLLRRLADEVLGSRTLFLPGHRLENTTPLDGDPASVATCLLFTGDVDLHRVDGPTGRFEFVQLVPVSPGELREAQQTSTEAVVAKLREESPGLVARLGR
jgi:Suppressor of fused protein (SUFU)